jgi:hypothetical protein
MARPGRKLNPILLKLIMSLDDDGLYTAATIATLADIDDKDARYKIRNTLNRFTQYHDFSPLGDGMLTLPGQGARAAWYGRRFKKAAVGEPFDEAS